MAFGEVIGQEVVKEALGRAVTVGRVCHAYLFVGPRGLGKSSVARNLAKAVNCRERGDGWEPCDVCPSCRQVDAGNHPDVRWVEPDGASIKIGQVRNLLRDAALKPFAGARRVFVISGADKLTAEAANSLLKVLEEPPTFALFVLTTAFPDAVLPTLVSRCQWVAFRPVGQEVLAAHLERELGLDPAGARLFATLSRGNPGLAREMAGSAALAQAVGLVREAMERLRASDGPGGALVAFEVARDLEAFKVDGLEILDLLAWIYRDSLVQALEAGDGVRVGIVEAPESRQHPARLLAGLRHIEEARRRLRAHANRRLVFDVLIHKLRTAADEVIF